MIDEKGLEAARRRYPVALQEACDLGKFPEHRMRYAVKEAITAYLSASAEPVAWHDMSTAPRDGSRFLATGGGLGADIDIVSYSERVGCWNTTNFTLDDTDHEPEGYNRPTRWTHIPPKEPT